MTSKIIKVKISDLHETEHNPRQITNDDFAKLKKSLQEDPEFLEAREIVVDENNTILGGHQRVKALQALGKSEIEVKQVTGWSDEKKRRFVIKDNVQNGTWDLDELANAWDDLPLADWGVPVKSFTEIIEDEPAPVDEENTYSVVGNIYHLGDHRVFCGSFEDDGGMNELFGDLKAVCTFTDPPYNVAVKNRTTGKTIKNDNMSHDDFQEFLNRAFECVAAHTVAGGGLH